MVSCPVLCPVYEHDKLGVDNLWDLIHSECVKLLDQQNIWHSSIDLIHFSWLERKKDNEDETVGILPDTLTGEVAFHSSQDILGLLREHGITNVKVVYHESVFRPSSGPELFAPISDLDLLKAVIDPLTMVLGLPFAGLKTLKSQGTMDFYFQVGNEWYAVTAHYVLFSQSKGNDEYIYKAGPCKDVILTETKSFISFLNKIQAHIDTFNDIVKISGLEHWVNMLIARSQGGSPNAQQVVNNEWTKPANCVIGHVIWAPPISIATTPHSYFQDVCIIKLDKKKFIQSFRGNVLDLGAC
ncbi:hypothetical protein BC827DRAFT_1159571 [Russula dissimulans]|nr:hypothetical protein BC827DRAFT_1159571 [Russula dissimulans]